MQKNKKKLLIKVFGPDKPGITSLLTKSIDQADAQILDLGQSVTHGLLSLSILIETHSTEEAVKVINKKMGQKGINLEFQEINSEKDLTREYSQKFIISSVHPKQLQTQFLSQLTDLCAKQNLNIIKIENKSSSKSFNCLDLQFGTQDAFDFAKLKKEVMTLSHKHLVDMAIVKDDVFRFNKRLIIFDMDSTLIECEVIEEIARLAGNFEKVKKITDQAMNGEIDFTDALEQRLMCLKGVTTTQMDELKRKIPLTQGIPEFIKIVKSLGFKTAVISGGFSYFANYFKNTLGLDYAFANELEIDENGVLTGRVTGAIVDAQRKATLLDLIAQQVGISHSQVVAIGDGANDLPMLQKAGMGIAFHAKDIVKQKADHHMSFGPMTSILNFLGIPEDLIID